MPSVYSIIGRQTQNVTHTKIKIFTWHRGVSEVLVKENQIQVFYSDASWGMMLPLNCRGRSFRRANKYLCSTSWVCSKWGEFKQRCPFGSWMQVFGIWRGDSNFRIDRSVYEYRSLPPDHMHKRRRPRIPGAGGGSYSSDKHWEGMCEIGAKPGQSVCYTCLSWIFSSI